MEQKSNQYSQFTLIIRMIAGGYLVYTAWNLREAIAENPLFIIAIVVFALSGAALMAHAGWKLYKGDYEGSPKQAAPQEGAEDQ